MRTLPAKSLPGCVSAIHDRLNSHGVILLRMGKLAISRRIERLDEVWAVVQANPRGRFIVITESKIRVRILNPES